MCVDEVGWKWPMASPRSAAADGGLEMLDLKFESGRMVTGGGGVRSGGLRLLGLIWGSWVFNFRFSIFWGECSGQGWTETVLRYKYGGPELDWSGEITLVELWALESETRGS